MSNETSPLLRAKAYDQPSVFEPANLLREGRRQRGRADVLVLPVCLLDPDGDIGVAGAVPTPVGARRARGWERVARGGAGGAAQLPGEGALSPGQRVVAA